MNTLEHTGGPVKIAFERKGSGPLVVFLHGIGGNRSNWTEQLDAFGTRFCALSWDARGYGASDDSPQALVFSDFADDLARVLDHLEAEKTHVVGLSMGGMIAQGFYGRYPDRVATLTLAGTSSGFGAATEEARQDFLNRRLAPLEAGRTLADLAPTLLDVLVAPGTSTKIRDRLQASMAAVRLESYKQALRAIITTDFRAVLPRISVPTQVVVGTEDQVLPPADSAALVAAIPGAEKVILDGIGHLSNLEGLDAFNTAVGAFLDRHADRASTVTTNP